MNHPVSTTGRRRRASLSTLAVVTAATCALASCSANEGDASSRDDSTILIGGTVSLTSPLASFPEVKDAQEAAVKSINAAGGINGRNLEIDVCDSKFEVSEELGCFRSLTEKNVAAIVSPVIIADTGITEYQVAQRANTAVVGSPALQPGELDSDVAFPLGASVVGGTYGAIYHLIENGAERISIFGDANNPAANSIVELAKEALASVGKSPVNVAIGDASTDPTLRSAAVSAVRNDTDGIIITGSPPSMSKSVPALRAQGYDGLIATIDSALPGPVIEAIGPAGDGMLVASQTSFPDQSPEADQFRKDMEEYAPEAPQSFFAIQAWSAVRLFAAVAEQYEAYTAEDVLAAFQNIETPIELDTIGPYQTVGVTSPITDGFVPARRMFNPAIQLGSMQDGGFVADGGFVNPFDGLEAIN